MTDASSDVEDLRRELSRMTGLAERSARRLRASHAVAQIVGEQASLEAAMPHVLGALGSALDAKLAGMWAPDGEHLVARTTWAATPEHAPTWAAACEHLTLAAGAGLPGRVWKDRGPTWLAALATDDAPPRAGVFETLGLVTGFGFPMSANGEVVGVIELFLDREEPPDDVMLDLLRTIGAQLGQFLAHTRTQSELQQERDALTKLNDLGTRINGELDQEMLVQEVTDVATELTGARFGAFFYNATDRKGEMYSLHALAGITPEEFASLDAPQRSGLFGASFDGRVPVRIDDITQDPRAKAKLAPDAPVRVRSYLAVPVVARSGTLIGALLFGHEAAGVFTERSQRIAIALAAHAATAMDNARLFGDAQRLIAELEKTNAELDLFAYAASHDLRAPLRGISNLAQWIEEDLGKSVPKKVNEHLQMLKGRAARMDKLITGLLELARIGRTRQKPERVDVTELLHDAIDLLSPPPKSRVLIIGAMPTMLAERFALQQVFMNLIANALQHSQRADVVVKITCTERSDELEFTVADNGVGIAPEHQERVWQIFQTLQSRDLVESTGMGLAIVRKQAEANGGRAWIDAAVTTGATVRFTWPKRLK